MNTIPIIHIIGLPGAGKTTLSKKLCKTLNVPVFRIGNYRVRFPKTLIGEADAWVELFKELSQRKWRNCILETTGLNYREEFLGKALPFDHIFTIKLEASQKILVSRIQKKKKEDQGGQWLFSSNYRDKYEFVRKLWKDFRKIPANCYINTNQLMEKEVYYKAIEEINFIRSMWMEMQNGIGVKSGKR